MTTTTMGIHNYFIDRARATMAAAGAPEADIIKIAAWAERERAAHPTATSPRSIIVDDDGHIHAIVLTRLARAGIATSSVEQVTDPAHDEVVGMPVDRALAILRERLGRPVLRLDTVSLTQGAGTGRVTGRRDEVADRMPGAELQAVREYLGLTLAELGELLAVRQDTVHRWESGRDRIPVRVREEVGTLENATADAVDALVAELTADPDATASLYHRSEALHAAHPEHARWSARWWRHVVMRALEQVDRDVVIEAAR